MSALVNAISFLSSMLSVSLFSGLRAELDGAVSMARADTDLGSAAAALSREARRRRPRRGAQAPERRRIQLLDP